MDTSANNLLVQACKLYLESEIFLTELKVLAYFTHKVTLPLLNCIAISDQNDLVEIFPKLWRDLKSGNMDTLTNYLVIYKHVPVEKPNAIQEEKLLLLMTKDAAETIEQQCGREYGFGKDYGVKQRATDISLVSHKERRTMPTDNVIAERDFAKFDHLARVAKY